MKRLLRWIFNTLAAASALVAVALLCLWWRSYHVARSLRYDSPTATFYGIASDTGIIELTYAYTGEEWTMVGGGWYHDAGRPGMRQFQFPANWRFAGFAYRRQGYGNVYVFGTVTMNLRDIEIPYWFCCLMSMVLPVWWFYKWRHRPRPPGVCVRCGYDLRATPGRCPECGMIAGKAGI